MAKKSVRARIRSTEDKRIPSDGDGNHVHNDILLSLPPNEGKWCCPNWNTFD